MGVGYTDIDLAQLGQITSVENGRAMGSKKMGFRAVILATLLRAVLMRRKNALKSGASVLSQVRNSFV